MAKLDKDPGKEVVPRGKKGESPDRVVQAEIVNPRCKVCKSPNRREIDMCLATGWSQAAVIRHFNQLEDIPFNKANMSVHASKHLRSSDAAVRRIWEDRARQFGIDVDSIENFILTIDGARDAIIYRGMELVQKGNLDLKGKDLLEALRDKETSQKSQDAVGIEVVTQQFKDLIASIKEVVDAGVAEQIFASFEATQKRREAEQNLPLRISPPLELVQPDEDDLEIDGEAEEVTE